MIGPPEEADVPALVGLLEELDRFYGVTEFEPAHVRAERVRMALFGTPPAAHALVARDGGDGKDHGGDIVGIAAYAFHWPAKDLRTSVFLKDLFVVAGHRDSGVGEQLLRAVRAIAAERGCDRVDWTVDPWNDAARRFYERLGARPDGRAFYRWEG
jgi:GNAT superfamily N-acetyltransferase